DCQKTQKEAEQTLGENRGLFMSVIATAYIAVDKQDGNTAEVMIKEILRTLFEQNDEHSFLKLERETTLVYLSSMLQTTPLEVYSLTLQMQEVMADRLSFYHIHPNGH